MVLARRLRIMSSHNLSGTTSDLYRARGEGLTRGGGGTGGDHGCKGSPALVSEYFFPFSLPLPFLLKKG